MWSIGFAANVKVRKNRILHTETVDILETLETVETVDIPETDTAGKFK